jgi:hypothetical protein
VPRRPYAAAVAALFATLVLGRAAPAAAALDVDVKELRAASARVTATIELRDVLPDRFRRVIDQGGAVHLRVQAEVWERRPVWDRLVYPTVVRVFRLARTPTGREIAVTDPDGLVAAHAELPDPFPVSIRVGSPDRLLEAGRYYAKVVATLGTIATREIEGAGDAVFGRPGEAGGLGSLGRLVFKRMLEISDYLQSVSAEGVSRHIPGVQILKP